MNTYRNWVLATALVISVAVNALQMGRAGGLARRAGQAERALRDVEEDRIKNLQMVIRHQRFMLTRFQLQLNALGNPALPFISPEDVERANRDDAETAPRPVS